MHKIKPVLNLHHTRKTDYAIGQILKVTENHFIGDFGFEVGDLVKVISKDWHQYHIAHTQKREYVWAKETQLKPLDK